MFFIIIKKNHFLSVSRGRRRFSCRQDSVRLPSLRVEGGSQSSSQASIRLLCILPWQLPVLFCFVFYHRATVLSFLNSSFILNLNIWYGNATPPSFDKIRLSAERIFLLPRSKTRLELTYQGAEEGIKDILNMFPVDV